MKWTDEVIEAAPYKTTIDTLNRHNCDFAVHGDDVTTDSGEDTYDSVKKSKRYAEVPRTGSDATEMQFFIFTLIYVLRSVQQAYRQLL